MRVAPVKALVFGMVLLALSVLPARAADGPVWTYAEAGYLSVDVDNLSDSGDNYFLGASFGLGWFHANGYVTKGDLGPDIEQELWRIGVGWHGLLGERADLLAEAAYIDFSVDDPGPVDGDETGRSATPPRVPTPAGSSAASSSSGGWASGRRWSSSTTPSSGTRSSASISGGNPARGRFSGQRRVAGGGTRTNDRR